MPYTPPTAQSPVASRPESPSLSRPHSYTKNYHQDIGTSNHGSKTELPHSSSSRAYLQKHRRSPSISKSASFTTGLSTPDATPIETRSWDSDDEQKPLSSALSGRVDQPPTDRPVVSTEISPPASPQTSSDDEITTRRGRVRDVTNLAELQAAIRIIEQHRSGSPDTQASEETRKARITLGLAPPQLDLPNKNDTSKSELLPKTPLSAGARKISHSRSSTDASAFFDFPRNKFDTTRGGSESEVDEDEDLEIKPELIRKKSGELVRPALRASSLRRRPSSMPGTPTYSKAVHFQDNSLEHVRHFLQVDRPMAVSAGSSPVDSYDEEIEFPFSSDDSKIANPPYEWEIRLTNFHRESVERTTLAVRTEKVCLSNDTKVLIGTVVVRNLAFHKLVVVRFTLDFWKTTSEVVAEYSNDVRRKQTDDGCDRFTFGIKLEDQANLENKTLFFCVRYNVNGQEYWDNNNSINYQVDFSKKFKPQNGKQGMQAKNARPLSALPRSKPSQLRPRSMPSFDDFASSVSPYEFSSFPQPSSVVGDSPIRFKNRPSPGDIIPDAQGGQRTLANQQAFGNRYDFGASLSAAIQVAGLPPKEATKPAAPEKQPSSRNQDRGTPPVINIRPSVEAGKTFNTGETTQQTLPDPPKPIALTAEKPSLQSSSYHELLDKYCFVRSQPDKGNKVQVR